MCEIVNFDLLNLTKPKKKFRNTMKCHNIFIISLFAVVENIGLIFYYLFYRNATSTIFS